jgi:hypothetical protein
MVFYGFAAVAVKLACIKPKARVACIFQNNEPARRTGRIPVQNAQITGALRPTSPRCSGRAHVRNRAGCG